MKLMLSLLIGMSISFSAGATTFDQTHGDIRVILVSVQKGRTFLPLSGESPSPPVGSPYVRVTYLVQWLGEGPIRKARVGDNTLLHAGKELTLRSNHPAVTTYTREVFSFSELSEFMRPSGLVAAQTDVRRTLLFGKMPEVDRIEVILRAGFNDDMHEFRFTGVPVGM